MMRLVLLCLATAFCASIDLVSCAVDLLAELVPLQVLGVVLAGNGGS